MAVAMTQEQLQILVQSMTQTVTQTMGQAMTEQSNRMRELTETMASRIPSSPAPPDPANTEERERDRAMGKSDINLTEKFHKRLDRFSGGDDEWEDWKYDFEIITRSINPAVGEALTECIRGSSKPMSADDFNAEFINHPWCPKVWSI